MKPERTELPDQALTPSMRDAGELAKDLGADLQAGLTSAEAARRLQENGANALLAAAPVAAWRRALAHR